MNTYTALSRDVYVLGLYICHAVTIPYHVLSQPHASSIDAGEGVMCKLLLGIKALEQPCIGSEHAVIANGIIIVSSLPT